MLIDFDDFCLYMYVVVDDIWKRIAPLFKRPGPEPKCSDSELITMALVGECRGWDMETEMLSNWQEHPELFPHIPSQSRFNRRRRYLHQGFNQIRKAVLYSLDLAQDKHCAKIWLLPPKLFLHKPIKSLLCLEALQNLLLLLSNLYLHQQMMSFLLPMRVPHPWLNPRQQKLFSWQPKVLENIWCDWLDLLKPQRRIHKLMPI